MSKRLSVVTLDGPAGVGKTTLARRVAEGLGLCYLDTGAMFRCMALKLGPGAETLPEEELRERCAQWRFTLSGRGLQSTLFCNGEAVRGEVRTEAVGMLQVPANRIGYGRFSAAELKTIQEVISLSVFMGFSVLWLHEPLRWNHLVGFALIVLAAWVIFKEW